MTTLPSDAPVHNFGMGLTAYIIGDLLPKRKGIETVRDTIEKIVQIPMASKLYIRPTWRQMQSQRGRLDMFEHWQVTLELAEKYNKPVGFRIMLANPDIAEESLPDFVLDNVPMQRLGQGWASDEVSDPSEIRTRKEHHIPYYHHPYFLEALDEFDALLAEKYNGHACIEYMDTYMHGFWGEGHTWPYELVSPFPDQQTGVETWIRIFEMQRRHWTKTPLVTNLQPDISQVGNDELVRRTLAAGEWLRSDTIFIEPQQIELAGVRPPQVAFISEVGMSDGLPESLRLDNGLPHTENIIAHVRDVGANYWSLWNWHNIHAEHVLNYYHQYPAGIDGLNRVIGYRLRPAWIWVCGNQTESVLIVGLANDGISNVPGIVRLTLLDQKGHPVSEATLEAGHPIPHQVRLAHLKLPAGVEWIGMSLKAELIVKGVNHPIRWACREPVNSDGSLTLKHSMI
ncbi:MAG: hypothetical protein CVU39_00430 [Chloroflexi bacterium HGW-Chloroflexi-10]|nr:MAG: hypothetical protein CVU39_00430 [Chloroflexi bacterium HGW-Chloroflexi-10]